MSEQGNQESGLKDKYEDIRKLSEQFEYIAELRQQKDELSKELKKIGEDLREAEELAAELLAATGVSKITTGGRTWWVSEQLHVNVPRDRRDDVLAAAEREGLRDELTSVNTATLKAWLLERAKENGLTLEQAAEGTAFQGLVNGYIATRLHSVRASQG